MARTPRKPTVQAQPESPAALDGFATTMKVTPVGNSAGLAMPKYETEGAAGMDLLAAITGEVTIPPGDWVLIPTGISIELSVGFEAQVRPRSGLAFKKGVTVLNAPGTIDRDFRGEVGVVLINHGPTAFEVRRGMRIAQLVVAPVAKAEVVSTDELSATERGSGGFGSTGSGGTGETG